MSSGSHLTGLMKYRFAKKESNKMKSCNSPPDEQSCSDTSSIPDTPESLRPSPSSPVLQGQPSHSKNNVGRSETGSASSKQCLSEKDREFISQVSNLQGLFPGKDKAVIETALEMSFGHFDRAVDLIIAKGSSILREKDRKRSRGQSQDSVGSPDSSPIKPPTKRAKKLSFNDDTTDTGTQGSTQDSTQEPTQDSQSIDLELDKKVTFLHDAFPHIKKEVLRDTLTSCDGDVDQASSKLQDLYDQASSGARNVGSIKAFKHSRAASAFLARATSADTDSEEEDEIPPIPEKVKAGKDVKADKEVKAGKDKHTRRSGEPVTNGTLPKDNRWEDDEEEISSDEELQADTPAQEKILHFLNESSHTDLMSMSRCSKKKADCLISFRPYQDWGDMAEKLQSSRLVSLDVLSDIKELFRIREVIQKLMRECQRLAEELGEIVTEISGKTVLEENDQDSGYITRQPANLSEGCKLKPYQMVGLNWLIVMHEQQLDGILGDEMGLGKTIQTIAFLGYLLEQGHEGPHIIVVPSSTIDNWLRELQTWCPTLKVLLYYGSQEERAFIRSRVLDHGETFNVAVTTYAMATGSVEDRSLLKKCDWHYAVFDEGHMLKNMTSMRYRSLMKIKAKRRLLLTGTPLQNNLLELISLLAFVMPHFFTGKTDHLKKIFNTITGKTSDENRSSYEAESIAHAKRILMPFFLRRLKIDVLKQFPKKCDSVKRLPMMAEQQALYGELRQQFTRTMQETKQGQRAARGQEGSAMLMQLRKAANHQLLHRRKYDSALLRKMAKIIVKLPSHPNAVESYVLEDLEVMSDFELHKYCCEHKKLMQYKLADEAVLTSGKFQFLDEILPKLKREGHRVLLFSQFVMMLDIIEIYMQKNDHRYLRLDGSTAVSERQDMIDEYNRDKELFIFLLSTKAGGLGINLTAADTVILHDLDFNPYNDKQAEDRCHRVGQTRDVTVYRLISAQSVEEAIWKCAQGKLRLEQDVTTHSKDEKHSSADVASLLREALDIGDQANGS